MQEAIYLDDIGSQNEEEIFLSYIQMAEYIYNQNISFHQFQAILD